MPIQIQLEQYSNGRIACHLRPLSKLSTASGIGRNIFNPLEAYEIDFSHSCVSLGMKEANATLGHRRLIIPTESNFTVTIVESIVDMSVSNIITITITIMSKISNEFGTRLSIRLFSITYISSLRFYLFLIKSRMVFIPESIFSNLLSTIVTLFCKLIIKNEEIILCTE